MVQLSQWVYLFLSVLLVFNLSIILNRIRRNLGIIGSCNSKVALVEKNPSANVGDIRDTGSTPSSGRSPGGGYGNLLYILAWRIPWTEEPGGLPSIASQRARQD